MQYKEKVYCARCFQTWTNIKYVDVRDWYLQEVLYACDFCGSRDIKKGCWWKDWKEQEKAKQGDK